MDSFRQDVYYRYVNYFINQILQHEPTTCDISENVGNIKNPVVNLTANTSHDNKSSLTYCLNYVNHKGELYSR